jgi:HD-GYP domain-containing protein (c-di-GMP phosphodiesterase class II)
MTIQPWLSDRDGALSAVLAQGPPPPVRAGRAALSRVVPISPPVVAASDLKRASVAEIRKHARRLATVSAAVGRTLQLPASDIDALRLGSLLHDIGKTAIAPKVLFKGGRLSAEEFAAVRSHTVNGDRLCARIPSLGRVRPIVRHHHERLDGSGYPDHLRGDDIPLLAQIVGIADVYDALIHSRPYKPAFDREHAMSILWRETQRGWRRADLLEALVDVVEREGDRLSLLCAVRRTDADLRGRTPEKALGPAAEEVVG